MEVPFERLGPGQVGRWAFQVLGDNGPIANPSGIRYMANPPEGLGVAAVQPLMGLGGSAAAAMSVAEAAALGLGVINLGVSVATLVQVTRLRKDVLRLELGINHMSHQLDEVVRRVGRIDVNVAEVHLREALRGHLGRAWDPQVGYMDLRALAYVSEDLTKFIRALEGFETGAALGLALSSDVRSMLQFTRDAFHAARMAALASHNRAVAGDPQHVRLDGLQGFYDSPLVAARLLKFDAWLEPAAASARYGLIIRGRNAVLEQGAAMRDVLASENANGTSLAKAAAPYVKDDLKGPIAVLAEKVQQYFAAWLQTDAGLVALLLLELNLYASPSAWEGISSWQQDLGAAGRGVLQEMATPTELAALVAESAAVGA